MNRDLTTDCFLWLSKDCLPFQTVEKEGLKTFLTKYAPTLDLPARATVSRAGSKVYYAMRDKIIEDLQTIKYDMGACTLDIWTDKYARKSYIGATFHFINEEFVMKDLLLDASFFPHPHTAEEIVKRITDITRSFSVDAKLKVYVTDQASNNVKFGNLDPEKLRVGCDAHALHHLVTTDAVNQNPATIDLVRRCKAIIRAVVWRGDEIRDACEGQEGLIENLDEVNNILEFDEQFPVSHGNEQNATHYITLKNEVPTRWTSLLLMLKSIKSNTRALEIVLLRLKKVELILNATECTLLDKLIDFLEVFNVSTNMLQGSKYPTLNLAVLAREELYLAIQPEETDHPIIADLKERMLDKWDHRLPQLLLHVLAALLDPTTKNIRSVIKYIEDNNTTVSRFLISMAEELGLGFVKEVAENRNLAEPASTSSSSSNLVADNQRRAKMRKLELLKKYPKSYKHGG